MALAVLLGGRDTGLPMPAAAVCLSPFLDLEGTGGSITTRADVDPIATPEVIDVWAKAYLGGADPRTPLANPLCADLTDSCAADPGRRPRGATGRLHPAGQRAQAAGVDVKLEVWPEMIHRWHSYAAVLPEGQQAIDDIGTFLLAHIP